MGSGARGRGGEGYWCDRYWVSGGGEGYGVRGRGQGVGGEG